MNTVGAFHAKTHFSALLNEVENGHSVVITKHGHPVAKIIPFTTVQDNSKKLAIEKLKKFSQNRKLGKLNWKSLRDKGRR